MIETYSIWNLHGEQVDHASSSNATRVANVETIVDPNDEVMDIIQDAFPFASTNINQEEEDDVPTPIDSAEFEQYEKLLKNANQELYLGCESFSVLTAIVELMHGKIKYRMSNLCFDCFLGVFKRMLPTDNCLLKDHKHAQKVLNGLGLGYEKIHACKNNCMLFYKEHETLDKCPICNESRSIDVYLRPLVDELKDLWTNAYAMVSGWSTKGYMACLACKEDVTSGWHAGKFPDGYASNIARCVNIDGGKFTGLKSHDCHVFMQRLLPVVLCKFEMIFPPAFFTSMIHVMVHLPEEALLVGPVNYRWMYPIERLITLII
ncbi:unnamed protein product [Prunus brigantina]